MRKDELQRTRLSRRGSLEKKEQGSENKSIDTDKQRLNFSAKDKPIPKIERAGKESFYSVKLCIRLYSF